MGNFADNLRQLRKQKDLKQKDLGEAVGLTASAIGAYERGQREPDFQTVGRLARELDVTSDFLLGLTDEVKTKEEGMKPTDLRKFLHDSEVMFNGVHLSERDKQRIMDILTGLFFDAIRRD
ncbi:putative HTH-type transcriptional regulator [Exiguobacterium phage vB_EauS-123]|nr:putative HTH-type transcriptional regulator [Exiguobacterium phage vB_EauS-123]